MISLSCRCCVTHPVSQFLAVAQLSMSDDIAREARRWTQSTSTSMWHDFLCCRLLQCQFTDIAEHNTGTEPYACTIERQQVILPGRLPKWADAFADHDVRRRLLAQQPGNLYAISLYTVRAMGRDCMDLVVSTNVQLMGEHARYIEQLGPASRPSGTRCLPTSKLTQTPLAHRASPQKSTGASRTAASSTSPALSPGPPTLCWSWLATTPTLAGRLAASREGVSGWRSMAETAWTPRSSPHIPVLTRWERE